MPPATPFVLLDDARSGTAMLYRDPRAFIPIGTAADLRPALEAVRQATRAGDHAAGWLAYEAGHALAPRRIEDDRDVAPLGWFGLFGPPARLDADALAALLPDPAAAWIGAPEPELDASAFAAAFERVAALIAAGDIYQANLSFRAAVRCHGHPAAVYARARRTAAAPHGALIFDGERWLLSFSPELFFRLDGGRIEARPMKGTGPRRADRREDDDAARTLADDPKQRAENLMIVDLMRNDIARVAAPGSVTVPDLFAVERYPTVMQMVSTVAADLLPGLDAIDVLAALHPCGSITGAPKLRAMEIISDLELSTRAAYTGTIGAIGADGSATFNVAIRTLTLEDGHGRIGLGAGIVADSDALAEWNECLAKGAFLTMDQQRFDLLETIRFDPDEGLIALPAHMARLKASAAAFGFSFNRHTAGNELHAATFRRMSASRVRLRLSRSGAIAIEIADAPTPLDAPASVAIVPLPVAPEDFRLHHKTSDRGFYDHARRSAGRFEVVFERPDGLLTEGSFTSLFVERDGRLVTPPRDRGLLPGVLRATLLEDGRAIEGDLVRDDLAHGFLIGNALRGLMPARLG